MGKHSRDIRLAKQAQQNQQSANSTRFEIMARAAHFSGPLPPPEILIKYNEAVPGGAERIMAMAEDQSKHRQMLEKVVVEANCHAQKTGPVYGFIICMTAILGGVYLIYLGKSAQGLAAIITALASLAAVFIIGKQKQQKELREKSQVLVPTQQP